MRFITKEAIYNSIITLSFNIKMYRKSKNISFNIYQNLSQNHYYTLFEMVADSINKYKNKDRFE